MGHRAATLAPITTLLAFGESSEKGALFKNTQGRKSQLYQLRNYHYDVFCWAFTRALFPYTYADFHLLQSGKEEDEFTDSVVWRRDPWIKGAAQIDIKIPLKLTPMKSLSRRWESDGKSGFRVLFFKVALVVGTKCLHRRPMGFIRSRNVFAVS